VTRQEEQHTADANAKRVSEILKRFQGRLKPAASVCVVFENQADSARGMLRIGDGV
jgi:hypothetical protein